MSDIDLILHGSIAQLHLNNPTKLNVLTISMMSKLEQHCSDLENNPNIKIVLLTAEGKKAFCAGADIREWADIEPDDFARHWVRNGHRVFKRLANLTKPTIAVISAHAFGGGLELAAACDLRVISPKATLSLPENSVGIVPGWSGTQRLLKQLPPAILKQMAFLGYRLSAERAFEIGFVNAVSDDAFQTSFSMAEEILNKSSAATEITKYMIQAALGEETEAIIEALGSGMISATHDKAEGVNAFREKRKPIFR